jgi:hypothetical protein
MNKLLCACGHPRHSIPCPDTSGDDGEGHVTICGCHRLVGDKLPALPPRPRKDEFANKYFTDAESRMDAQDARISELTKTGGEVSALYLVGQQRITELKREIREAHELLNGIQLFPSKSLRTRVEKFLKRNAEKEQAS